MSKVKLVVADCDGTLLDDDHQLTQATIDAVHELHDAGIGFTLASARPPRGLQSLIRQLAVTSPVAAFNGGMIVTPDMKVIRRHTLPAGTVDEVSAILHAGGLDLWAYCGTGWYVLADDAGYRLDYERGCVGFDPIEVDGWEDLPYACTKLVGVCDDYGLVAAAEHEVTGALDLSAGRSTPFYLDITAHGVNKGRAVEMLARWHNVPLVDVAVIGDGGVDVPMFRTAGLAIAMGNASQDVQDAATVVTRSNHDNGFARAMREYVLH